MTSEKEVELELHLPNSEKGVALELRLPNRFPKPVPHPRP
jgi:hypothetical protein